MPQPTLSIWLKSAGNLSLVQDDNEKTKRPEDWTAQEKLAAVSEAATISDADLGAWLRSKGLTEEHLKQWRHTALSGFSARPARASATERKRVKQLERELRRKDKALAETAALLVLQGKMEALWAAEDGPTRQSNDEQSSRVSLKRKPKGRG